MPHEEVIITIVLHPGLYPAQAAKAVLDLSFQGLPAGELTAGAVPIPISVASVPEPFQDMFRGGGGLQIREEAVHLIERFQEQCNAFL